VKATLIACSFAILAFDEKDKLLDNSIFAKNPQFAAKIFSEVEEGKIVDSVRTIVKALMEKAYHTLVFENQSLGKTVEKTFSVNIELNRPSSAGDLVRSRIEELAIETGFVKNTEQFTMWMRDFAVETAKLRVKGAVE